MSKERTLTIEQDEFQETPTWYVYEVTVNGMGWNVYSVIGTFSTREEAEASI